MNALQQLQELDYKYRLNKYPHAPAYSITPARFNDSSANRLTACILRWFQLKAIKAWRQASEGRYRPGKQYVDVIGRIRIMKGQYFSGTNKGHGDISSIIKGIFCAWEVKMNDKQSKVQLQFQHEVEQSGGKYFLVHSFDDFLQKYNQLFND